MAVEGDGDQEQITSAEGGSFSEENHRGKEPIQEQVTMAAQGDGQERLFLCKATSVEQRALRSQYRQGTVARERMRSWARVTHVVLARWREHCMRRYLVLQGLMLLASLCLGSVEQEATFLALSHGLVHIKADLAGEDGT